MPKHRTTRIYTRQRGGVKRYYADLRSYADVGGRREPLIPEGEKLATTDRDIAEVLLARRIEELDAKRRGRAIHGIQKESTLAKFSEFHLVAKKKAGIVTDDQIACHERYLNRALEFFGDRELSTITVGEVREWLSHIQTLPNGRGGKLSAWTARMHLGGLSNLYRRAASEGYVQPGFNPASAILEKPPMPKSEAKWLEIHDASLYLEAARTLKPREFGIPFGYELVAVFLSSGGRESEVYGLEVDDVSFDRKTITFRDNEWRRLKTAPSQRVVPLWPQLRGILEQYMATRPPSRLLFPSFRTGTEAMLHDSRKYLDAVAVRVGWKPGEIRTKIFRHTYCATRLQTLDHGAPVSIYTVSRELGHGSTKMVERVYAHLGEVRHRSEVVEYRAEQHKEKLGDRLTALQTAN